MEINTYRTDPDLELEGTWVQCEDAELLIARWNNTRAREYIASLSRDIVEEVNNSPDQKMAPGKAKERLAKILSESILLGWRGNMTLDGEALEYSKEKCYELMLDETLNDLRTFVIEKSMDRDTYLIKKDRDIVGN